MELRRLATSETPVREPYDEIDPQRDDRGAGAPVQRAGVRLDANVSLPRGKPPFPTVLYRSPYPTGIFFKPATLPLGEFNAMPPEHGYAIVHRNERGR